MRRYQAPHPDSHDYTAEIEMLRQEVLALSYRQPSDVPSASTIDEAMEAVTVAFEELHAVNEALTQTQQVAMQEQQRYWELFTFAPDGYLVTDLHGIIQEANQAAASLLHIAADQLTGIPQAPGMLARRAKGNVPNITSAESSALRSALQAVPYSIDKEAGQSQ